uniref:Uncharacterized protein n=1 Tax=Ixodes ricinus TaxID=34613 RepID=A0A0K8RMG4_IXORI
MQKRHSTSFGGNEKTDHSTSAQRFSGPPEWETIAKVKYLDLVLTAPRSSDHGGTRATTTKHAKDQKTEETRTL